MARFRILAMEVHPSRTIKYQIEDDAGNVLVSDLRKPYDVSLLADPDIGGALGKVATLLAADAREQADTQAEALDAQAANIDSAGDSLRANASTLRESISLVS